MTVESYDNVDFGAELGKFEYEFAANARAHMSDFRTTKRLCIYGIVLILMLTGFLSLCRQDLWQAIILTGLLISLGIIVYLYLENANLTKMAKTSVKLYSNGVLFESPRELRLVAYSDILDVRLRSDEQHESSFVFGMLQGIVGLLSGPVLFLFGGISQSFQDNRLTIVPKSGKPIRIPDFVPHLSFIAQSVLERAISHSAD